MSVNIKEFLEGINKEWLKEMQSPKNPKNPSYRCIKCGFTSEKFGEFIVKSVEMVDVTEDKYSVDYIDNAIVCISCSK